MPAETPQNPPDQRPSPSPAHPAPKPIDAVEPEGEPSESPATGGNGPKVPVSPVLPVSPGAGSGPSTPNPAEDTLEDEVFSPAPAINPVVAALISNGLYLEKAGEGLHSLTCPWAAEHAAQAPSWAEYWEPSVNRPIGRFRCTAEHADRRDAQSLIDHLGIEPAVARARPVIRMHKGETHRAVAASELILANEGNYFGARGPIIRLTRGSGGALRTEEVNDQTLENYLASRVDYYRRGRSDAWERCDPPAAIIRSLRYNQDRPYLKHLNGLSRQPFYAADGVLVREHGYHGPSGIFGAFDPAEYDIGNPTREDAEREVRWLKWLLREFHFPTDADLIAAICAILTASIRTSLALAPAFHVNAPRSGSGKSFLAALIALAADAGTPYNASYPTTNEEATKLLLAVLLEKPAVVLFDDMSPETGWKSLGPVNKALTSPSITERMLNHSRTATAGTNVLFLGTGNNVEPTHDLRRRVLVIHLDRKSESPALDGYEFDPVAHIRKNRGHIVKAALTIIEAYRLAGSPKSGAPSIGSYGEWSMFCREPLIWLGEPDPATRLISQVQDDPDQHELQAFLKLWGELFEDDWTTVREVVARAQRTERLRDALDDLGLMDGDRVNTKKLGRYLVRNKGRWAGGLRIQLGPHTHRNTYRVVEF